MPLRSKLIIFGVVVLLLFLGLSVGAFFSLSAASRDAEMAREELEKLSLVESLERCCAGLGADPDPVACRRARRALDELAAEEWRAGAREQIDELLTMTGTLGAGAPIPDPDRLGRAVADLKASILVRVEADLRLAEEPTHRRAVRLLVAAALAAIGCSATFAWLYARLIRERRALEERVRRSEKLAALGTLAAGVAHEINNPLTSITMSAEALRERIPTGTDEAGYTQVIQEEAERCLGIVADLSDLARGGAVDREPVDADELAREAVRLVRRNRPGSLVQVLVRADPDLPLVAADRGKLLQVLLNLLRNGLDAAEPDGRVELTVGLRENGIAFRVADTGRGIPAHLLERIFEPFYTDKARGVGLGLTLCHRIAELHGGDLVAESPGPNRGSVFTLTLPLGAPGHVA